MEITLTVEELAYVNELDALKGAFNAGIECAKQSFLQRVMRDRAAQKKAEPPPPPPPQE